MYVGSIILSLDPTLAMCMGSALSLYSVQLRPSLVIRVWIGIHYISLLHNIIYIYIYIYSQQRICIYRKQGWSACTSVYV